MPDRSSVLDTRAAQLAVRVVVVLTFAVAGAWLLWAAWSNAVQPKTLLLSYQIGGDREVTVRFEVVKPADAAARCVVRARNEAGLEVGRAEVDVPAGERRTVVTHVLRTRDRPVGGELAGCRTVPAP